MSDVKRFIHQNPESRRRMKLKSFLAVLARVTGGVLALPSILALFFGAMALRLLPWFPSFESVFKWGAGLGLAALAGSALLKQSEIWNTEASGQSAAGENSNQASETSLAEAIVVRTDVGTEQEGA